jgi:hypothetical protein
LKIPPVALVAVVLPPVALELRRPNATELDNDTDDVPVDERLPATAVAVRADPGQARPDSVRASATIPSCAVNSEENRIPSWAMASGLRLTAAEFR